MRPNIRHESDCAQFYHCGVNAVGGGTEKVLKSCGPRTLFSVVHMICTHTDLVREERPECATTTTATTTTPAPWKVSKCVEDHERWEREHGSEAPREATFFPDPFDCKAYIECVVKRTQEGLAGCVRWLENRLQL